MIGVTIFSLNRVFKGKMSLGKRLTREWWVEYK